jgi:putative heme-binding domain-containing protein
MPIACLTGRGLFLNFLLLSFAAGLLGPVPLFATDPVPPARVPWTTSRVVGSPDPPPPFKIVQAFPNLKFEKPLLLARCPGSDRLFVGEQAGVLYSFRNEPQARAELFCDLRSELKTLHLLPDAEAVESVYGLVFHPDFENNRQCFVCYTLKHRDARQANLADGTRVSRFTVTDTDPPRIDPATEEIVLTFLQGGHNGGDLHFGRDGMLYISTGDATSPNPPDALSTGQDISDLLSSILRIDVDHQDAGRNYAIPPDNPFVGWDNARPEVWAYGFRNPWRMSFDRQTGELFVGDVGWELWEMVYRIEKGGNYGWAATEGPQPIKSDDVGPTPIHPPLIELPHTIACSVTGGFVYRGEKFPELRGAYVFGDWETRRLWAARFQDGQTTEMPEIAPASVRVVAFGEDNAGELYFLDYDSGTLHTLERNDAGSQNTDFPTTLSQTGLFASVKDHTPAEGVTPFVINSRQWRDGATAEHWAAFPGTSSARLHATGKPIPGLVQWHNFRMHFPKDAVLMRTFSLDHESRFRQPGEANRGDRSHPETGPARQAGPAGRRIETQILHYDGLDWRGYTYAWRDDQQDADLVPADGDEREIRTGEQSLLWQFHSRTQCLLCHNNHTEYALAFVPEQLNRPDPHRQNQLIALTEAGFLHRAGHDGEPLPPFDSASAARESAVADPADERQPIEARALAYLHANCGHCHSENGGGTVALRLQFPLPVDKMYAVDVRPARGDFGLPDARIIKPGDPYASTLYFRMAKFGRDRMPHIGSQLPDEAGLTLIEQWIAGLATADVSPDVRGGNGVPARGARDARDLTKLKSLALDQQLARSDAALLLARRLGRGDLNPADRDAVLAAAAALPSGPARDLFDGYLSPAEQGERKLGSNPRPRAILAIEGDAGRGEALFHSQALNCANCHRVGDRGRPVGPDLSNIGALRTAEDLLDSLLSPSRRIEPKYAVYVIATTDGRIVTGQLVKRDEREIVLFDAQGKEITLAAADVDELRPSRTSLMPEGQLAGLTAREAADLLAYLTTRRSDDATVRSDK